MNDPRDLKDAESVRSGLSHITSQPPELGIRMVYRETFLQIQQRLLQHPIRKGSIRGFPTYQNTHHRM